MDMYQYKSWFKCQQKQFNLFHNAIYTLFQLREETHKCQFNSQQGKNRFLKLIEKFIEKMSQCKPNINEGDANDLKEKCLTELYQCLVEEQANNNKDKLFKIIEKINGQNESCNNQNQVQLNQFVLRRSKQIRGQLLLNQNATLLITEERLYGFNNNHKLIKKFINNQGKFSQFIYLKNSAQFLLRFYSKMIICNNEWISQQLLQGHAEKVCSLIMNKAEDFIISGSNDKTIKFWKKDNSFWTCQQTIITEFQVLCLCLNSDQTKLVVCGNIPFILFVELQNNNQWIIMQKLKVDIYGYYVCFISNNSFVFHPLDIGILQIFNYQNGQKQFIEGRLLLMSNRRSKQNSERYFNNKTKVLTISYDLRIYFYLFNDDGDYQLQHLIELEKGDSFKSLHHDNQLIAIQKNRQQQILFIKLRNQI